MSRLLSKRFVPLLVLVALLLPRTAAAVGPDPEKYEQVVNRAIKYLETKGQAPDGSFTAAGGVGITALVTTALIKNGRAPGDPLVAKSLEYLKKFERKNGGIYSPKSPYRNYETCMAIMCFAQANKNGKYDKLIKKAELFIKGIQWDEGQGIDKSNPAYGGAGYGEHKRPDLSNTTYFIDALKAAGAGPDDPNLQKALWFVKQIQNFEGTDTVTKYPAKNPDGGFVYTAAGKGETKAPWPGVPDDQQAAVQEVRGLRSYGSMTYAGLKSMIYAGMKKDDPRIKAAYAWVCKNYSLKENPGLGKQGLYYYYHTFAKALDAMGNDFIVDAKGVKHDWRREMVEELAGKQKANGSWTNEADRWMEGDPNLVTGFVLLTLSYCGPKK